MFTMLLTAPAAPKSVYRTPGNSALLALALVVLAACNSSNSSEAEPPPPEPEVPVGIEAIKQRGVLRLLTRNNGHTYFVLRGEPMGFDYEVAELYAKRLGVRLEVSVPPSWGALIPELRAGRGDIIGAGMTVTPQRQQQIRFARPYGLTHVRIVWGKGRKRIAGPQDLSGTQVHVRRHSAYFDVLEKMSMLFEQAGMEPVDVVLESESMETERILEDVAAGKVPYTLCDNHLCLENKRFLPKLQLGPAVSELSPMAWAVHPDAVDLADDLGAFFMEQRIGRIGQLYEQYYDAPSVQAHLRADAYNADKSGKISEFDEHFKTAGRAHHVDWRLLAALAYQASRFDPLAKTWGGGRGLFGMSPRVAKRMRVKSKQLLIPELAAKAAAQRLSSMLAEFKQVPLEDERLRMAIAAYEVGEGHVTDARILASKEDLDPDKWSGVAKVLPLLARKAYASASEHGYVRGGRAVKSVQDVWERYRAFKHVTGDRD